MARIDPLIDALLERKGSDLHLEIGAPPLGRVKGELVPLRDEPMSQEEMEPLLMELLSIPLRGRIEDDLDVDFAHAHGDRARFRASYLYTTAGLGAVFRRVPLKIPSLADLRLPPAVRVLAERRAGLVLVTGAARSGKSMALAAMVQHVNATRACRVLCVEDPIEYLHEPKRALVTQREVGAHVKSTEDGLRDAAQDDAEVVVATELRGTEAMRLALDLAARGMLVLGTMTGASAASVIDRIGDEAPEAERPHLRAHLAKGLAGIVSLQLVDGIDRKARVAAAEIMLACPTASARIRAGQPLDLPALILEGQVPGMQTMDMSLERLVADKAIAPETALERAADKEAFLRLGGGGKPAP
jgi:twitching motility protein PilT